RFASEMENSTPGKLDFTSEQINLIKGIWNNAKSIFSRGIEDAEITTKIPEQNTKNFINSVFNVYRERSIINDLYEFTAPLNQVKNSGKIIRVKTGINEFFFRRALIPD